MRKRILFTALLLLACNEDKATPDFQKCVDLEAKGKLDEARVACTSATSADPKSKDGLAAAAKIAAIDAKVQQDKARVEAEAASRAAAETKSKEDQGDAKCKGKKWGTKCMTGHRPDGTEKWTGMQWFDTRAECQRVTSGTGTCDECACM
jgi:hypothetical protein